MKTVYKSVSSGAIFADDLTTVVEVDLSLYKLVSKNEMFETYERKPKKARISKWG